MLLKYWLAALRTTASPCRVFAAAAIGADLRPAFGIRRAGAPGQQIHDASDDRHGIGLVEASRLGHRTRLDALTASRAGIQHMLRLIAQHLGEGGVVHGGTPLIFTQT
jgi:hypothetical protein